MKNLIFIAFLLSVGSLMSQEVAMQISSEKIQVGDVFDIVLEKEVRGREQIRSNAFPKKYTALRSNPDKAFPDSLPLNILYVENDTVVNIQGKWYWQRKVGLQCLDSGYLILPPLEIEFKSGVSMSQAGLIRVDLVPEIEGQELYDIKEYFTELPEKPFDWNEWFRTYGILILSGLFLILALYFFWRARKNRPAPLEPVLSPEEIAIAAIEKLNKEKGWANGEIKPHFVELSMILKQFLTDKYGVNQLEKTSFEIVQFLKKEGCSELESNQWSFLLNVSDLVKFAKSNVEGTFIESLNQKAIDLVKNHVIR